MKQIINFFKKKSYWPQMFDDSVRFGCMLQNMIYDPFLLS